MSTDALDRHPATRPEGDLGWSLGVLLRAYHGALESALRDLPHRYRGYQVLAAVMHGDKPSQLALAEHLGIDRTVMTYLIDDLVAAGLVERRLNTADRRQRTIVATELGATTLDALEHRVDHAETVALRALDDDERAAFRALLQRVACGAKDIDADRDPCEVVDEALSPGTATGRRT